MTKRLAYYHQDSVFIADFETQKTQVFTKLPNPCALKWNPDGVRFVSGRNTISIVDVNNKTVQALDAKNAIYPCWHPSRSLITYSIQTDKGWMIQCYSFENQTRWLLPISLQAFQVDWHPNGEDISYVGITPKGKHIFTASVAAYLDGENTEPIRSRQITQTGKYNHAPAWSPDGQQIAFESKCPDMGKWGVTIINADGSGSRRVSADDVEEYHPSWSPNGKYLAVERSGKPNNIFILSADGKEAVQMTTTGGQGPAWLWPPTD